MLKLIPLLLALALSATAQDLPAGAVKVDANSYRLVDKDGKEYLYRKTPFGLSRFEVKPQTAAATFNTSNIKVTDLGDSYRFVQADLFASRTWTIKKTELTAAERAIVDKSAPQKASK
jgi:hypothetical protein